MTLTDDEIKSLIRKSQGWTELKEGPHPYGWRLGDEWHYLHNVPNYPGSLDACAEFEKTLTTEEQQEYFYQLNEEVGLVSPRSPAWLLEWSVFKLVTATARQRCLAYLKTKGILP